MASDSDFTQRSRLISHMLGRAGSYLGTSPAVVPADRGDGPVPPVPSSAADSSQERRSEDETAKGPALRLSFARGGVNLGRPLFSWWEKVDRGPDGFRLLKYVEPEEKPLTLFEAWGRVNEMAYPCAIYSIMSYASQTISLMFVGNYLGAQALAGVAVAIYMLNMCALYLGSGLAGAMDTLCSQEFGRDPSSPKIGVLLQRSLFASVLLWCFCAAFVMNCGPILEKFFTPVIATNAGLWLWYSPLYILPSFLSYSIQKYFQNQTSPEYPMYSITFSVVVCPLLHLILIDYGVVGAIIALSVTTWLQLLVLSTLLFFSDLLQNTWTGWSWATIEWEGLKEYFTIGFYSILYVGAEASAFDVTVLIAGVLGEHQVDAFSIILSCLGMMVSPCVGISDAACTRVGNALGSGDIRNAKTYCKVCLMYSVCLALFNDVLILVFHHFIFRFYTDSEAVIDLANSMVWLMCITHMCDAIQFTFLGIFFGCGQSRTGAALLISTVWCIGIPASCYMAFYLNWGTFGVLLGVTSGLSLLIPCLAFSWHSQNWEALATEAIGA